MSCKTNWVGPIFDLQIKMNNTTSKIFKSVSTNRRYQWGALVWHFCAVYTFSCSHVGLNILGGEIKALVTFKLQFCTPCENKPLAEIACSQPSEGTGLMHWLHGWSQIQHQSTGRALRYLLQLQYTANTMGMVHFTHPGIQSFAWGVTDIVLP